MPHFLRRLRVTAAAVQAAPARPGLLSAAGAALGPQATRRAAPNTHADSGGPAPQSKAAVPGTVSRPVPMRVRSRPRGQSKCDGLTSSGEGPVWHGSRAGRVVGRFLLFLGPAAGW